MRDLTPTHPLRRLFAGLTEHAFQSTLGVADPQLVDYISMLLSRFVHVDSVFRLRDGQGQRIQELIEMVREAESLPPEGRTRREYHRHIGDFALFWTGLYPETISRMQAGWSKDCFVSYTEAGKRSYLIASSYEEDPYREEAAVLRRLGQQFELCAYGLHHVRKDFDSIHLEGEENTGRIIG